LNKKNLLTFDMVALLLLVLVIIPGASATGSQSCSKTSSNWTKQDLCGHGGMIAIIVTSHDPTLENDLAAFDTKFGLPACTISNGCLEYATPFGVSNTNPAAHSDVSFYVEQAHATAPGAKILVVDAKSISWQDKYDADYYAKTRPEVQHVFSVSWSKVVVILGMTLKK